MALFAKTIRSIKELADKSNPGTDDNNNNNGVDYQQDYNRIVARLDGIYYRYLYIFQSSESIDLCVHSFVLNRDILA